MIDRRGEPLEDRRRRCDRWSIGWSAAGLVVLGHTMWSLRWAHLYRQRTNEGLAFLYVFGELLLGTALLSAGIWMLVRAASLSNGPQRRRRHRAVIALSSLVPLAWGFAAWVESRGTACIGGCG